MKTQTFGTMGNGDVTKINKLGDSYANLQRQKFWSKTMAQFFSVFLWTRNESLLEHPASRVCLWLSVGWWKLFLLGYRYYQVICQMKYLQKEVLDIFCKQIKYHEKNLAQRLLYLEEMNKFHGINFRLYFAILILKSSVQVLVFNKTFKFCRQKYLQLETRL